MAFLRRLFGNWWFVSLLLAAVVALLLVLGLPILVATLQPLGWRLILLGVVVAGWLVALAIRMISAGRASARIARSLVEEQIATGEQRVLAKRMSDAIAKLKAAGGRNRNYLYSRPWYLIIGPPGGGKTTALAHSGLRFPLEDTELKGTGGTRNLDFCFADEAVLVDTAGRYTSQEGDARDRDGWRAFLDLLRRNRPLQPVNGVIIGMPLDELIRGGVEDIDRHAATIKRRVDELRIGLQTSPPIYVMLTKADLVAGFSEFYDDLLVDGRRAVLGSTFPWRPGEAITQAEIAGAFDELAESIAQRMTARLQDVRDARRRALILGFPSQVAALRARIVRLLEGAFPPAASGEEPAPLRGFYFTSGVQDGTPLDRILSSVSQVYDAPQPRAAGGGGRAYFINQLLTDVIFREAGLARPAPALVSKRRAAIGVAFSTIGAAALVVVAIWMASFYANRGWQRDLTARIAQISSDMRAAHIDTARISATDPGLDAVEPILTALRELPGGYDESFWKSGWRFWLQSDGLRNQARQAYLTGLQRMLAPRLALRLEGGLGDHSDAVATYERLKVYLLLGGEHAIGRGERTAIKNWADAEFRTIAMSSGDDGRQRLSAHVAAMLDDPKLGQAWEGGRIGGRKEVIDPARGSLTDIPKVAYAVLLQEAQGEGAPLKVSAQLDSAALQAFQNPDALASASIPYFYTRDGYQKLYLRLIAAVPETMRKESWVLGPESRKTSITEQMTNLPTSVGQLYVQDYATTWNNLLKSLLPADYRKNDAARAAIQRSDSPLVQLVRLADTNTRLADGLAAKAEAAAKKGLFSRAPRLETASKAIGAGGGFDVAREIQGRFTTLHLYATDPKNGVAALADKLRTLASASAQAGSDPAAADRVSAASSELQSGAADAGPLQNFVQAASGGTIVSDARQAAINTTYQRQALSDCHTAVEGLYPFVAKGSADATVGAVQRAFGLTGTLDDFIAKTLTPSDLIDRSGPIWRWRDGNPMAAGLDPTSPEQFMKASRIHDLLVNGVSFRIQAVRFGGAATAAEVTAGGTSHTLDQQAAPQDMTWSLGAGLPATIVLRGGKGEVARFAHDGPWALFRLFDDARTENVDPQHFNATFSDGAASVTLQVTLKTEPNPFGRGFWSFRCPAKV